MGFLDNLTSALASDIESVASGSGEIGSIGDIVFNVSAYNDIKTIDEYKRTTNARISSHDLIGQKPVQEFIGPGAGETSFKITLSAYYGVNPESEAKKLRKYCETGEVLSFVLGGEPVGDGKWLLKSVGEDVKQWFGGKAVSIDVNVSLIEYGKGDANGI